MARKLVSKIFKSEDDPVDSAVSEAIQQREEIEFDKLGIQQPRVRISLRDYYKFKAQAALLGIDMAVLLGDLIRQYLESASS